MDDMSKELLLVGDRVLLKPEPHDDKTRHGLYLPQGVREKERVQSGTIVKTGPGYPMPDPSKLSDEAWKPHGKDKAAYIPLDAQPGDYVLFLRDSAVELEYEGAKYLVAPQSAILVIVRDHLNRALNDLTND